MRNQLIISNNNNNINNNNDENENNNNNTNNNNNNTNNNNNEDENFENGNKRNRTDPGPEHSESDFSEAIMAAASSTEWLQINLPLSTVGQYIGTYVRTLLSSSV